jgi:hypothetical protein
MHPPGSRYPGTLNSVIASFLNALLFAKLGRNDNKSKTQKQPCAAGEPVSRRGRAGTIMMLLKGGEKILLWMELRKEEEEESRINKEDIDERTPYAPDKRPPRTGPLKSRSDLIR